MSNFVLIPGAWLGSWVWKKVTPILEKKGYGAYPITLTGMGDRVHLASEEFGMETAIRDVMNVIEYNDVDDIIMVGHSFAGKVAAAVANEVPEMVKMILYLDSFWPKKNMEMQGGSDPTEEFGALSPGSFTIPFSEEILDNIGKDVKGEDRKWMLSKVTPWPIRLSADPITLSERFDSIKMAHIFCTLSGDPVDEIVAGKWGELRGPYKLIEAGHFPMVTRPEELVDGMISLAES